MARKGTKKHRGGKRSGTRKASKWNLFVKKIHAEMKKKDSNASFGDAMKMASKRKSEM